jgi:anion-transporting  ArsA/GET3 family ATPase
MKYTQQISKIFSQLTKVEVPVFAQEIKGLEALNQLKATLFEEGDKS